MDESRKLHDGRTAHLKVSRVMGSVNYVWPITIAGQQVAAGGAGKSSDTGAGNPQAMCIVEGRRALGAF